ncbi:MAG: rRNA maturation RNase YbeY [Myxococcaceae bacterium]|nr:rRNA maturation RNase YbeY [Myxococcaceae bacterium]
MPSAIYIRRDHPRADYAARLLRQRARAFLAALDLQDVELSISLVDDAAIAQLNAEWRHKPQPTDVLSFPAGELPPIPGLPRPLGDVVISLDTARRRAREEGVPLASELSRYLAHGLLHLLGHDHQTPEEARAMSRAEQSLLGADRQGMLAQSPELEDEPATPCP